MFLGQKPDGYSSNRERTQETVVFPIRVENAFRRTSNHVKYCCEVSGGKDRNTSNRLNNKGVTRELGSVIRWQAQGKWEGKI